MKNRNSRVSISRKRLWFASPLAFGLLGACTSPPPPTIACFPKETQRWIWSNSKQSDESNPARSEPMKAKLATIYVDRSASMLGYLNGANNDDRPFQILTGNLPTVIKIAGAKSQFRAFGVNISEPIADAATFQAPAFYSCAPKAANCESKESHLDKVFEMIAKTPGELGIVITDLWYDNSFDGMGGPTALQEPLTDILQKGRTVALYGIEAPFAGTIYDIPAGGTAEKKIEHNGTHPLFVMAIGSKNDVMEFDRQLGRSGARIIREGLADGSIPRSIFTIDPGPLKPNKEKPIKVGNDPDFRPIDFEPYPGLRIQQFRLNSAARLDPGKTKIEQAMWRAPDASDFLPHTVWQGDYRATVDMWSRLDEGKCDSWSKQSPLVSNQAVERGNGATGQFDYAFDRERLANKMRRPGTYLISGHLERVSVDSPNKANDWANAWSFNSDQTERVMANRQAMFPTLNLTEMMRIMENALRTATERTGGGVVGFTVLVRSED